MKKTLLPVLCVAAACGLANAATVKTDIIDLETVQLAAAAEGLTVPLAGNDDFASANLNIDGDFMESGITYKVGFLQDSEDYMRFMYSGFISTVDNPDNLYISEIRVVVPETGYYYGGNLYVRETPVEYHGDIPSPNVGYSWDLGGTYPGNSQIFCESDGKTFKIEEPYKHMVFQPSDAVQISKIEIDWTDEAPVPQVKTPSINFQADATGAYPSPLTVNITCGTVGATVNWSVTNNGTPAESGSAVVESEWTPISFTVTGNDGDRIVITAVGTKEGFSDSQSATGSVTISLPGLNAPYSPVFYGWDAVLGATYTIANNNEVGTLHYTVNGVASTTEEKSVTLTVTGNIGDNYAVEAWITEPGYTESRHCTFEGAIVTNKLKAPEFDPASGELRSGTTVMVNDEESWKGKCYAIRINGGEWEETDDNYSYKYKVTEAVTIEAKLIAQTEGEYSYYIDSDVTTAVYTVEALDPELHYAVTPHIFFDPETDLYDNGELYCYFYATAAEPSKTGETNGVQFELTGNSQHNWNFSDNCFYDPYFDLNGLYKNVRNNNPIPGTISRVKVDYDGSKTEVLLHFSNSRIDDIENLPSDTQTYTLDGQALDGQWLNLSELSEQTGSDLSNKKYFALSPKMNEWGYANSSIQRILLEKGQGSGIEGVCESDADAVVYYDLNGMRVNADRLGAGIYVKVAGGKSSKVIVK